MLKKSFLLLALPLLVGGLVHAAVFRPQNPATNYGISVATDGVKLFVAASNVSFWYDDFSDTSAAPTLFRFPGEGDFYPGNVAFAGRDGGMGRTVYNAVVGGTNLDSSFGEAYVITNVTEVDGPNDQTLVAVPHEPKTWDYFGNVAAISPAGRFIVGGWSVERDDETGMNGDNKQRNGQAYAYDISNPAALQPLYPGPADATPPPMIFGTAGAISDTHLIVGSTTTIGLNNGYGGRAFLYKYNEGGSRWEFAHTLAFDAAETMATQFGATVALNPAGTVAAVTATGSQYGSVHLFDTGTGARTAKITRNTSDSYYFGRTLVLSDTRFIAGTPNGSARKVWIYDYDASGAEELLTLSAADTALTMFGRSVALHDDEHFAIGANNAVITGRISSMLEVDGGSEECALEDISFESTRDWIIGDTESDNTMLLGKLSRATLAAGKAVYVGKSEWSDDNALEVHGTITADNLYIGTSGNFGNSLSGGGTIAAKTTVSDGSALTVEGLVFTDDLVIEGGATLFIEHDIAPVHIAGGKTAAAAKLAVSDPLTVYLGGDPTDWVVDTEALPAVCLTVFTYDKSKVTSRQLPATFAFAGHGTDLVGKAASEALGLKDDGNGRIYIPYLKNTRLRLAATPATHAAAFGGGTFPVTIDSNISWTATSDAAWLTVPTASAIGAGNAAFNVTVALNPAITPRTATVTIAGGGVIPHVITVTQAPTPVALTLTPMNISAPLAGNTTNISLTANAPWTAAVNSGSETWLSVSAASGNAESALDHKSTFTVTAASASGLTNSRYGFVTVTSQDPVTSKPAVVRTIVVAQGNTTGMFGTANDRVNFWTHVDPAAPSVTLAWDSQHANLTATEGVFIYRRGLHETGITSHVLVATVPAAAGNTFVDTDVEHGKSYEYRFYRNAVPGTNVGGVHTYIAVAVDTPVEDDRGTILFVVDETLSVEMEQELRLAEMDLAGDGWNVKRIEVGQHDPAWTALGANPSGAVDEYPHMLLKERIRAVYDESWDAVKGEHRLKALYLFGRVPIARSGSIAPDGHAPARSMPTELYYADMEGLWIDTSLTNTAASGEQANIPGDGKFDHNIVPMISLKGEIRTYPEIQLMTGRVDFGRMSGTRKSEREHLRDYIQKTHVWKHAIKTIPYRTASFGTSYGEFTVLYPSLVALAGGPANHDMTGWPATNIAPYLFTAQLHPHQAGLDVASTESKTFFSFTISSWQLDWYMWNSVNMIRAPLSQAEWGYLGCWGGRPQWFVHHMAAGLPAGYSALRTVNARISGYPSNSSTIQVNLFGDPTLRLVAAQPPKNLTVAANGGAADLAWQHPITPPPLSGGASVTHEHTGYRIYRSASHASGYERIATLPSTATSYTDPSRSTVVGDVYYQVRATYRTTVPTAIYNHQSQGIFNALIDGADNGHIAPIADTFQITATRSTPTYLPFGGTGAEGATLTPIVTKNPEKGQVRWGASQAHYVSDLAATGADSLRYRLWDGLTLSEEVTVDINVVAETAVDSKLLLGWRFPSGDSAPDTPGSTYRKTPTMLASTLTRGSASPSAAGIVRSNKGFPVGAARAGEGPRGNAFDPNSYIGWTVAPTAGNWQSLDGLAFFVFGGNRGNGYQPDDRPTDSFNMELRYSTDNFATPGTTVPIRGLDSEGKFNATGVEKNGGIICSAGLSDIEELQNTNNPVQFRLYFWGALDVSGQTVGLGKSAETPVQNPFDIAVYGTTSASVAFNANGADEGTPPATVYDAPGATASNRTTITLPGAGTLAKDDHNFAAWNTQPDASGEDYAAGTLYTIPATSATLYARWISAAAFPTWAEENHLLGSAAAPEATPHNDGITNLAKFALGLDGKKATRYTETGYYTLATVTRTPVAFSTAGHSSAAMNESSDANTLVFTYAVNGAAESTTTVVPLFSKDLHDWQLVEPKFLETSGTLNLYQAEGDFTDGKGFFRLEIREN